MLRITVLNSSRIAKVLTDEGIFLVLADREWPAVRSQSVSKPLSSGAGLWTRFSPIWCLAWWIHYGDVDAGSTCASVNVFITKPSLNRCCCAVVPATPMGSHSFSAARAMGRASHEQGCICGTEPFFEKQASLRGVPTVAHFKLSGVGILIPKK